MAFCLNQIFKVSQWTGLRVFVWSPFNGWLLEA